MARQLGLLGTGKIKFKNELLSGQSYKFNDPINHHIGTTRMSESSKTGLLIKIVKFLVYQIFILQEVQFLQPLQL